ncbi:MAG: glutaminyl-peptide cyclotransferase [Gemmatimonadaceae bacterium]|nr:glutaminyl-peptide cyclotransferase [Gemmatimonadaceae bacterium]
MAILSAMRRSRTAAVAVLLATVGFIATAGAFGACGKEVPAADSAVVSDSTTPARTPTYAFEVVATYPHDPGAFTEGLFIHDGRLFESTGEIGTSSIREVDLVSGRVLRKRDLPKPYFGEGIVIIGDVLYELTWKDGKAFMFDWKTFAPKGEFAYEGEGWALTTDGTSLIMSDGTPTIRWRDPKTFAVQKSLTVTDHGTDVTQLNELEWIKGELWANVWQSDQIARIDPKTGQVVGWIDLSGILPAMDRAGKEDVLNGIAYDAAKDRYFVTGKYWPKLFEIRLKRRS